MSPHRLAAVSAAVFGAVLLAWTQIPSVWSFRADAQGQHPEMVFTGSMPTYADDAFTYYAWMRLAREGDFLLTDLYTTEPHPRNYVNVLFFALGGVCRATGLDPPVVHALARPVLAALLLLALWVLSGKLFEPPLARLACFLFFLVQGGWAGVADYFHRNYGTARVSSFEWWTPEISTIFSMVLFPHFLAGFLCVVGTILCTLRAWAAARDAVAAKWAVGAGLLLTLLTFFHPYDVLPAVGAMWAGGAAVLVRDRRWPRREIATAAIATAVWLPSLLYNAWIFSRNPAMQAWDVQNVMTTPEWDRLVVALGIGGVLAVASLFLLRRMPRPLLLIVGWFLAHLVLIQVPVTFQRRMIGGIQFPMAALGVYTLSVWAAPMLRRLASRVGLLAALRARLGDAPVGASVLAAALFLFPLQFATPQRVHRLEFTETLAVRYPAWIRASERDALSALERLGGRDDSVFASYEMGGLVPPFAGRRAYFGHYALTIDALRKEEDVKRFFSEETTDVWRLEVASRAGAKHVLWTSHERALGGFDPASRPWLVEVFRAGSGPEDAAVVYEIVSSGGGSGKPASESPSP